MCVVLSRRVCGDITAAMGNECTDPGPWSMATEAASWDTWGKACGEFSQSPEDTLTVLEGTD